MNIHNLINPMVKAYKLIDDGIDVAIGGGGILAAELIDSGYVNELTNYELNVTLNLVLQILIALATLVGLFKRHLNSKKKKDATVQDKD